jgi:2-(3-amino-3-carboxypropyl)histidine synthase
MNEMWVGNFEIDLTGVIEDINRFGFSSIGLHVPEGLSKYSPQMAKKLEDSTDCTVLISPDPCYGACDFKGEMFSGLGCQAAIEVGHAPIPGIEPAIKTYWVNAIPINDRFGEAVEKSLDYLEGKRVGILTTFQWIEKLPGMKKILTERGYIPLTSKGDKRIFTEGLILGCDLSAAKIIEDRIDCFLLVVEGFFHALALSLVTEKPIIQADPIEATIRKREIIEAKDKLVRQRYSLIGRAKSAKNFGIVVSTKKGQERLQLAKKLKKKIEEKGKKAILFATDELHCERFNYLEQIECIVSTACPRVALDDWKAYKKPIIMPTELMIVLDETNKYEFDSF